ncbi:unnamed protein product [Enterobius vermicularis]|uniref:PRKCSH domain-containing protein n=1 Tax=Enterobius vermicularis TaxID=51028 RepID=A0A0N4V8T8_ENTVE|nr:unnamed protein product [Enterobius vermicularis]
MMEHSKHWVSLYIIIVLPCFQCSKTNFIESQEPVYDIKIDEVPLGFAKDGSQVLSEDEFDSSKVLEKGKNNLVMTSQYGQKFICTLPAPPKKKEEKEGSHEQENLPPNTIAKIVSAGFYTKKCTNREFLWWTYEVCYGSEIKQYHVEAAGTVTSTVSLGFFSKNMEIPTFKPNYDRPLYFEQQYSNGTLCDLTGKPRRTVVRYFCEQLLATNEVFIDEVDESSTCEYVINVKTGSLCKLSSFLPVGRNQEIMDVKCRPWLQGEQVSIFIAEKENERLEKEAKNQAADFLFRKATSIQKQRYSRKRLALKNSRAAKKAALIDKRLKGLYESYVKEAWRLNSESSSPQMGITKIVLDYFGDAEEAYHSTKDQEHGDLYWYFHDPFWDKSFFPPTFGYVRALNKFEQLEVNDGNLLKKIGDRSDRNAFIQFLHKVEKGIITEADLSNLLGPLSTVFQEDRIPTVENSFKIGVGDDGSVLHSAFQKRFVEDRLRLFENRVIKSIVGGDRFAPQVVMSKVARDLLSLKNLVMKQERFYKHKSDDSSRILVSYDTVEKVFTLYQDAYNRAIRRFDCGDYHIDSSGDVVDGPVIQKKVFEVKDMKPENINLLYYDELAHELHEVFPASESGTAWEENRAQSRMVRRAKRHNLRELVEIYFRKGTDEVLPKENFSRSLFNKNVEGIKAVKGLLKSLLKDSGFSEADITIHVVTSDGEILGTSADDSRVSNWIKALLEEQAKINDEVDKYQLLDKAYSFGTSKEEKDARGSGKETRRSDLPIIREVL